MKIKILFLFISIFFLCNCCESDAQPSKTQKNSYTLNLVKGEGTLTVRDTVRIAINTSIPSDKVVLVSIDGNYLPQKNSFTIRLVDDKNNSVRLYGGWYLKNRMSYFVTSGTIRKYFVEVIPDQKITNYIVNVKIDDRLPEFSTLDSKGNPSDLYTYMISNSPEELKPEKNCMGENGCYLVRSKLQGNANIYWEHCNDMGHPIKFGVLMWNKDSKPLQIKMNSSSAISWTEANGMEGAMCGVWKDWFANKLNKNELNTGNTIDLPAYSAENPAASAKWIFMSTVPSNEPVKSTFNGLLNVSILNSDATLYKEENLFCDVYALTPGQETQVLNNVAQNDIAQTPDALRGSGKGAMLYTTLPQKEITSNSPYRFVITGYDPPLFQKGENIETYYYDKAGKEYKLPGCYGYSVVYKFKCAGFKSKKTIKAAFRMNPNSNADIWAGAYLIARRERDNQVTSNLVLVTKNDWVVFDDNVPQTGEPIYDIIVSGMSSLPVEIMFSEN
ncbi:MAG: hypothetical protein Q8862_06890 [Bacteroidota bacterium]|nr:hypothetical protein [Bacteroidota bacterium]